VVADRPLPQNLQAEASLLSSLLVNQRLIKSALEQVSVEAIYGTAHRAIYRAMGNMHDNGESVDCVTMIETLRKMQLLTSEIESKLYDIMDCSSSVNIDGYCRLINEAHTKRQLITRATRLIELAGLDDVKIDDLLTEIDDTQSAVRKSAISCGFKPDNWHGDDLSVAGMLTSQPPAFDYLIDGFLTRGVVGCLVGQGGAAKSLFALNMAIYLATCENTMQRFLDRFVATRQRRTLYLHLEDLHIDLHHRLNDIKQAMLHPADFTMPSEKEFLKAVSNNLFILPREAFLRDNSERFFDSNAKPTRKFLKLTGTAKEIAPDLIFVDTRSKASLADENKNHLAALEVEAWTRLRDETGASVIILAHSSKIDREIKSTAQVGPRGGSAYLDNARWGINFKPIEYRPDGTIIEIRNEKSTRSATWRSLKMQLKYPVFIPYVEEQIPSKQHYTMPF
jgi:hypothetical protein